MKNIRVASVQMESKPLDKSGNLDCIEAFVARAGKAGVQLAAFPECAVTSYMPLSGLSRRELLEVAEPVPKGPSTQRLLAMAARHKVAVAAGLIESDARKRMYKAYVVATPQGKVYTFHKFHPFVNRALTPGRQYVTFEYLGWRFGILICYDNNQPENNRVLATLGVQVLLAPHQTGAFPIRYAGMGLVDRKLWERREQDPAALQAEFQGPKGREWLMRWLPSRAYDNGCYVVFSNGVGLDGEEIRTGNAMILDVHGRVMSESRAIGNDMTAADLAPEALTHNLGYSHLLTRRPALYRPLTRRAGRQLATKAGRDAAVADKGA